MSMRRSPKQQEEVGSATFASDSAQNIEQRGRRQPPSIVRRIALLLGALSVAGLLHTFRPTNTAKPSSTDNQVRHDHHHVRKRSSDNANDNKNECSIYMAPSSLKGNGGNGIFTTRDIKEGSTMLSKTDGPSIPVVDYMSGRWTRTWNEYWWQRGVADHVLFEVEDDGHVMDYQFGFGSMPNHHCILNSLTHKWPTPAFDDSLVNRPSDPGTGAFSYSMGREFIATKDLKAGDEVFLNYGYCHRGDGETHGWPALIPMKEDYEAASTLAWAFLQIPSHIDVDIVAPIGTDRLVSSLLPKTTSQLRDIVGSTRVVRPSDLIPLLAKHVSSTPRTPNWIKSHGLCLEHLTARKSNLPHAGQGGFAQHSIKKGDVIVPAPLIQIEDRKVLQMYDDDGTITGSQLLLNYCFGHTESSLLLCPETNALLINHCSDRRKECGEKGPNAKYHWSSGWEPLSEKWLKMTVDEIAQQQGRGLSMEIVALRDIEPGEEVYFDYGIEWEEAWENHIKNWNPPSAANQTLPHITAKEANEQQEPLTLLVTGDLRKISKHPYLFTGCRYRRTKDDKDDAWYEENPTWMNLSDEEILETYADDGSQFYGTYERHRDRAHWPCSVIRQESNGTYTVRIHQADWEHTQRWSRNKLPRLLTNYPRDSIHYFVKPYTGDQYLPGVFRQPIGIRDEIFPEQWKNRKASAVVEDGRS